jgi:4-hydroxybutyrate dehydrogenase
MSLIRYVTRIHFADRVIEDALSEELKRIGARAPMIVVDRDGDAGDALDRVRDTLPPRTTSTTRHLRDDAGEDDLLTAEKPDAIVALGGERAILYGRRAARRAGVAFFAAPTTAACLGVEPLPDAATPAAVFCDPTLSLPCSPARTAETGFDALGHCLEAYLGDAWNPPADGMALEGVRRAGRGLERAVRDGADLDARREVLAAGLNAGLAAQKGHGALEAVSRALEAETGLAARHGRLHGAIVAGTLAFNAPAAAARYRRVAEALDMPPGVDLAAALAALAGRLGLPTALDGFDLAPGARARAAAAAAAHPASRTNPRRVTEADYRRLIDAAFEQSREKAS